MVEDDKEQREDNLGKREPMKPTKIPQEPTQEGSNKRSEGITISLLKDKQTYNRMLVKVIL